MINIIGAIISGLIIGALARFFYPGAVPMGFLGTILLGVVGSLVGGFIGSLFSKGKAGIQPAAGMNGAATSLGTRSSLPLTLSTIAQVVTARTSSRPLSSVAVK